jgi:1-phosphofructokinase
MIVTVTSNPSVDRTLSVDRLTRGAVMRVVSSWSEPSGKGVNVALALHAHGLDSRAVLPVGGVEGQRLESLLRATGLDFVAVRIGGEIRSNVSVIEPNGTTTKFNEPGPAIDGREAEALTAAAIQAGERAEWLVCCGSLPVGVPATFYAELVAASRRTSARIAVDTSGAALTATLSAGPDLIKPNVSELAQASGGPVGTLGDVLAAVRHLQELGARSVLASLGPDGAVLVEEDGDAVHGEAHVADPRSAVGAGDALLAGFLAGGASGTAALRTALSWAAAAVRLPGTVLSADTSVVPAEVIVHDRLEVKRRLRHSGLAGWQGGVSAQGERIIWLLVIP